MLLYTRIKRWMLKSARNLKTIYRARLKVNHLKTKASQGKSSLKLLITPEADLKALPTTENLKPESW